MNSSSSSLSSDWDIVSLSSVRAITKESVKESPNENPLNTWKSDKGRAEDEECSPVGSGVVNLNGASIRNQNDNDSSSDIDVIEEALENPIQMRVSTMKFSTNSSKIADSFASSLPPPSPVPVEEGWIMLFQLLQRLLKKSQIKDYLVIVSAFVIIISSTLHFLGTPSYEMKDQVEKLRKENNELKNQAISSKMESDMLFHILDEQIKAMRSDNQKLSKSMQSLAKHMEEQSTLHGEDISGTSPNCFLTFFRCFSQTFIPRWW